MAGRTRPPGLPGVDPVVDENAVDKMPSSESGESSCHRASDCHGRGGDRLAIKSSVGAAFRASVLVSLFTQYESMLPSCALPLRAEAAEFLVVTRERFGIGEPASEPQAG